MIPCLKRRRGALLYLFACCSFLAVCFLASFGNRSGGHFQRTGNFEVYPWQMIGYDEDQCGCPRSGPPIVSGSRRTLCSEWSTSRGLGQKVVSYTLYGDPDDATTRRKYFDAVEGRLLEVEKLYKGFVVRLYHNLSTSDPSIHTYLCNLYCKYPHLDPCQVKNIYPDPEDREIPSSVIPNYTSGHDMSKRDIRSLAKGGRGRKKESENSHKKYHPLKVWRRTRRSTEASSVFAEDHESYEALLVGKMWRFLPMADPLVAEFLVRDVDSTILDREASAVEQWRVNSTALLHAMRDHPRHNGVILAGLWGGSRARGGETLSELFNKMVKWPPRNVWDYDQMLLKRVVWPEVMDDLLVHDSYFCADPRFQTKHRSEPFPTKREERYFVGWGPTRNEELKGIIPCPRQCRPVLHQEWILC